MTDELVLTYPHDSFVFTVTCLECGWTHEADSIPFIEFAFRQHTDDTGHTDARDDGRPDILACLNCRFARDVEPASYPSVTDEP